MIIPALPAERARCRPALEDQVVGLFKPRAVLGGIEASLQGLHGPPTDKARDEPSSGVAVQHRQFFRHPHRSLIGKILPRMAMRALLVTLLMTAASRFA